jgi:hypothetical protein
MVMVEQTSRKADCVGRVGRGEKRSVRGGAEKMMMVLSCYVRLSFQRPSLSPFSKFSLMTSVATARGSLN